MDVKNKIRSILQEAEIYRGQGLIEDARNKYNAAATLIGNIEQIKNKEGMIDMIMKKIQALESEASELDKVSQGAELSPKVQDLVKKLFTFTQDQDEDGAALEGAITLAKFGQYESALVEFNELIKKDALRVVASKNILRCHIARSSIDDAITQYKQWINSELFSSDQLENIRIFLENLLEKKGVRRILPHAAAPSDSEAPEGDLEEEILDISAIGITFDSGPHKGKLVELEVSFQTGNLISLIISSKDRDLIENLKVGFRLNDVQFYSPVAIFHGAGIVTAKTQINSGPKRGDYSMDIKIVST